MNTTDDARVCWEVVWIAARKRPTELLEIVQKIGRKSTEEHDPSAYWTIAVKLGKAER